jgi:RNA polymerase sigma factor (TIGR02999 family)
VSSEITTILGRLRAGDTTASEELLPLVYDELRRIAAVRMNREKPGQTLQGTALVHEAWLRLIETHNGALWNDRQAFFSAASEAMRRILVDVARRKASIKHGGQHIQQPLDETDLIVHAPYEEVIAVSDALEQLHHDDATAAQLVKLHYFAGLSLEEAGEMLEMSRATAYRTWTYARTFLRALLAE